MESEPKLYTESDVAAMKLIWDIEQRDRNIKLISEKAASLIFDACSELSIKKKLQKELQNLITNGSVSNILSVPE